MTDTQDSANESETQSEDDTDPDYVQPGGNSCTSDSGSENEYEIEETIPKRPKKGSISGTLITISIRNQHKHQNLTMKHIQFSNLYQCKGY